MVVEPNALPFPDAGPRPPAASVRCAAGEAASGGSGEFAGGPRGGGHERCRERAWKKCRAATLPRKRPAMPARGAGDLRRATRRAAGCRGDGRGNAGDCRAESGEDDRGSGAAGIAGGGFFGRPAAAGGRGHGRQSHRAAERPGTGGEGRRQGHAADTGGDLLADFAGESAGGGSGLDGYGAQSAGGAARVRARWRPTRGLPDGWSTASRSRCRMSRASREAGWCGSRSASRYPGARAAADAAAGGGAKSGSEVHRGGGSGAGGGHGAAVRRDSERRARRRDRAGASTGRTPGPQRAGGAGEVGVRARAARRRRRWTWTRIFEIPFHLAPRPTQ